MAAARRRTPTKPRDRLKLLETRLASLEARLANLEGWKVTDAPPGTFMSVPAFPPPEPVRPFTAPVPKRAFDIERTLGGNLLAKAGIAVLVIGVVFFLKYAFDEGWINRPARLALGFIGGLALAVTGDALRAWDRSRFGVYGQVLMAGGVAIVYFTAYAMYAFPEYRSLTGINVEAAAVLLGLIALALLAYAALRGTPVLTMEALLLGTLASFFGERWIGFAVVYQTALALASLGAAAWKRWGLVQLATVGATYLAFFAFLVQDVDRWWIIAGAIVVLGAVTVASFRRHAWPLAVRSSPRDELTLAALWPGGAFLAAWGVLAVAYEELRLDSQLWHGPTTAVLALAAIGLAFVRVAPLGARWGWGVAGTVMALSWPPMQFDGSATAYAWAGLLAVCAAILWMRRHLFLQFATLAATGLLLAHLVNFEFTDLRDGRVGLLAGSLPFAAALISTGAVWVVGVRRASSEDPTTRLMLAAALFVPLLYAGAALEGYAISIAWAVQAVVLVVAGFALRLRDLRIAALLIFALVLGRVFLIDMTQLALAVRIITFLAVGTLLLVASFLYTRRRQTTTLDAGMPAVPARRTATPRARRP